MYDIIHINNLYYIYNNLYKYFFSSRTELCIIIHIMYNNFCIIHINIFFFKG